MKVLAHGYKTNLAGFEAGVAGQNGDLAGGGETSPPPLRRWQPTLWGQPGGVTETRIRCLRTTTLKPSYVTTIPPP